MHSRLTALACSFFRPLIGRIVYISFPRVTSLARSAMEDGCDAKVWQKNALRKFCSESALREGRAWS
eukprot:636888-Prorocentrum_minimum.AAC.2